MPSIITNGKTLAGVEADAAAASAAAATASSAAATAQTTANSKYSAGTNFNMNGGATIFFSGGQLESNTSYGTLSGPWHSNGGSNGNFSLLESFSVTGSMSKGSGSFLIDHPLDPANKYLLHSFVESPDMKNIYDGVVTADGSGNATITLPDYFMALNDNFRYQLTCIGGYAPVYISSEIAGGSFSIAGATPGLKVSWQVTGIRKDAYAAANRIPVEVNKLPEDQGKYLHPVELGSTADNIVTKGYFAALEAQGG